MIIALQIMRNSESLNNLYFLKYQIFGKKKEKMKRIDELICHESPYL